MSDDTLRNIRRARQHVKREEVIPASNGMEAALTAAETGNRELARLATLGAKVEALLASEEPPEGLRALYASVTGSIHARGEDIASEAWAWFREQVLGDEGFTTFELGPDFKHEPLRKPLDPRCPWILDDGGRCAGPRGHDGDCRPDFGSLATGGINPAEELPNVPAMVFEEALMDHLSSGEGCGYVKPDDPTGLGLAAIAPKPWRLARSLSKLRGQLAELYPKRNRASDGAVGDARHASNKSDHNPWVVDPETKGQGVVTAIDITHDLALGIDCRGLADRLVAQRDRRIKYLIFEREICASYPTQGIEPWEWRPYTGSNPHTKHLHLSVKSDPKLFDSTEPWRI